MIEASQVLDKLGYSLAHQGVATEGNAHIGRISLCNHWQQLWEQFPCHSRAPCPAVATLSLLKIHTTGTKQLA